MSALAESQQLHSVWGVGQEPIRVEIAPERVKITTDAVMTEPLFEDDLSTDDPARQILNQYRDLYQDIKRLIDKYRSANELPPQWLHQRATDVLQRMSAYMLAMVKLRADLMAHDRRHDLASRTLDLERQRLVILANNLPRARDGALPAPVAIPPNLLTTILDPATRFALSDKV